MPLVSKEQMDALPKIVAVDFDGTLVEDRYPEIGAVKIEMFNLCHMMKEHGVKLILWTSRDGEQLADAVECCENYGLVFDAVNENVKEIQELFHNDTRKIYADLYIDDKAVPENLSPFFWMYRIGLGG